MKLNGVNRNLPETGGLPLRDRQTDKKTKRRSSSAEPRESFQTGVKNVPAAKSPQARAPKKDWTIMYYASAGDRMEEMRVAKVLDLEKIGSSKDVNILAQIDRGEEFTTEKWHGGKPGMSRYFIEPFKTVEPGSLDAFSRYNPPTLQDLRDRHDRIDSPEAASFGQVNASSPKVIKDYIAWGMKNYPARHYLIMFNGHGAGVTGLMYDDGPEAEKEHHIRATIPEFAGAVKDAREEAGVDKENVVVDIRSCLVGNAETAYEMKDSATSRLASQAVHYSGYWRLEEILSDPNLAGYDAEQMAKHIAEVNSTERGDSKKMATSALLDLKQAPKLKKAILNFEKAVKANPQAKGIVKKALEATSRPNFFSDTPASLFASDFFTAAHSISEAPDLNDPQLKKAAQDLKTVFGELVLRHDGWKDDPDFDKNAQGMGITTASNPAYYQKTGYKKLAFDKDTGWSDFMTSYAPDADIDEQLDEPALKDESLKEFAQKTREMLADKKGLKADLERARGKIKLMERDQDLTPMQKGRKIKRYFSTETGLYTCSQACKNEQVAEAFDDLVALAAHFPDKAGDIVKTGLLVFSALDGEVSTETLSQAARNLVKSKENINPKIKNRRGAECLILLAKISRNDRVLNLRNRSGLADAAFIKNLAKLTPAPQTGKTKNAKETGPATPEVRTVLSPRLTLLAMTAKKLAEDPEIINADDHREIRELFKHIERHPELNQLERPEYRRDEALTLPVLQALTRVNGNEELDIEQFGGDKKEDRRIRKLVDSALSGLAAQGAAHPEALREVEETALLVFSALKGDIGEDTLAQAARNVLEAKSHNQSRSFALGAGLLQDLGRLTGIGKTAELEKRFPKDPRGFLEALAG